MENTNDDQNPSKQYVSQQNFFLPLSILDEPDQDTIKQIDLQIDKATQNGTNVRQTLSAFYLSMPVQCNVL